MLGEVHRLEFLTLHPGDAVEPGEAFIEEAVARGDQLFDRPVLAQDEVEQHLGLALHVGTQADIEGAGGVAVAAETEDVLGADRHRLDVARLQPLADEAFHQTPGARIGEHAVDLRVEVRPQLVVEGEAQQFVVGHRAPEKEGKPRGDRVVVKRHDLARIVRLRLDLDPEQETRRGEAGGDGLLDAVLELLARLFVDFLHDVDQAVDGRIVERLAEGAADEAAHDFPRVTFAGHLFFRRGAIDEDHPVALRKFLLRAVERALEDDALDHEIELLLARRRLPCRREADLESLLALLQRDLAGQLDHPPLVPAEGHFADLRATGFHLHHRLMDGRLAGTLDGVFDLHLIFAVPSDIARHLHLLRLRERQPAAGGLRIAGGREVLALDIDPRDLRRRAFRQRQPDHLVGGGDVFLHQQRRDREHVADVVEAVAGVVGGEDVLGVEFHAEQVVNRVLVFGAVQPADGHAAGVGAGGVELEDFLLDPGLNFPLLVGRQLVLVGWRHHLAAEISPDRQPVLAVGEVGGQVLELVHRELALGHALAVAGKAVGLQQRDDLGLVALRGSRRESATGGEQGEKQGSGRHGSKRSVARVANQHP